MKSTIEKLAETVAMGHDAIRIAHVRIGRTEYSAGMYRDAGTDEVRMILTPVYRTDWVNRDNAGPRPNTLPASYVRNHQTIYHDGRNYWYVAAYHTKDRSLFLFPAPDWMTRENRPVQTIWVRDGEPFETAIRLASPDIRERLTHIMSGK